MTQEQMRSTLVTVLAWIFIALSGFGTIISIVPNILVLATFNSPGFDKAMQPPTPPGVLPSTTSMASHLPPIFLAFLVISALFLASSIGLLLRRNWARLSFAALMILATIWQLAGLALQFKRLSSFGILLAMGSAVLFVWIANRLLSAAVAAEFGR